MLYEIEPWANNLFLLWLALLPLPAALLGQSPTQPVICGLRGMVGVPTGASLEGDESKRCVGLEVLAVEFDGFFRGGEGARVGLGSIHHGVFAHQVTTMREFGIGGRTGLASGRQTTLLWQADALLEVQVTGVGGSGAVLLNGLFQRQSLLLRHFRLLWLG